MENFRQKFITPFVLPVVTIAIIWIVLSTIGKSYLNMFTSGESVDRIDRPELWTALAIMAVVIAGMALLALAPTGAVGPLDKPIAVGSRAMNEAPLPAVDVRARRGELGTVNDITEGYTLYASSGKLATVDGVLPGGTDYGKRFAGFFHARGDRFTTRELWIPFEAVTSVYPETRSAFLAIKGDETEAFGWNTPPENLVRGPKKHMAAADKTKDPTIFNKHHL